MKRRMFRLRIFGLREDLDRLLIVLQGLACVAIEPVAPGLGHLSADGERVQAEEALALLLSRVQGLLTTLGAPETAAAPGVTEDVPAIQHRVASLADEVRTLVDRRDALLGEQTALPRYQLTLRRLVPLIPAAARRSGAFSTVVLVAESHRWVLRNLTEQVAAIAPGEVHTVEESIGEGMQAMLIVVPAARAPRLQALLGKQEIAQMQLPDAFADIPPDQAVAALDRRLQEIPEELTAVDRELRDLSRQWAGSLRAWQRELLARLERHRVQSHLGATARTFILEGWCPAEDVPAVREALTPFATAHLTVTEPRPEDDVPVALANPRPARPFESLVRLMALPRYRGLDPTPLMTVFLPLFFGMILGDVGYAAVIFVAMLAALRRFREPGTLRDLLFILLIGSIWGAIFGLLYGEAFGTLGARWGLHPLWLERAAPEYVTSLLLFSLGVGGVHVTLGLLLGIWLSWQERSRRHLLERGGMLLGLLGLLILVGVLTRRIPTVVTAPGVAILVVGVALLSASHGWLGLLLGPIEFVGLLGNILSYLRIAAVGLASVYVALVANELAGNLGSLILGVVVAVLIHALNILLGAFSPTIHGLRLHYVEFFRKFYEGGGRPFQPFGARRD